MKSLTVCHAAVVAAVLASVLAARPLHATAQTAPAVPDVQKLGPQAGATVPGFTLQDQHGQSRSLTSLMGPNGLMLVFFRSADW